jgi:CubicO group peptidase (beta-lactamase class C family)
MTGHKSSMASPPSRRSALGLLGAASLAVGGALAAPSTAHTDPPGTGHVPRDLLPGGGFDRFLAQRAEADQFSGTVLLAYRGRPVLTRSYGMADASRSIPNGRDTIFNLASVTKSFTAVAFGQLVQQGRIQLDETLGTYLDGFSAETSKVTIHQLLTHTAGMGHYYQAPEFLPGRKEWNSAAEVMDGIMAIIRKMETQPRFIPGTRHVYSNSGYVVLGAIVAQASGLSYHDYMRRQVLVPAGMRRSDLYSRPQVLARRDIARPYWTQPSGERVDFTTTEYFGFIGGPAEGVYSTAPDLLEFVGALRDGRLLSPAYTDLFTNGKVPLSPTDPPIPTTPAQSRFYGYGFRSTITGGQRIVGHSGTGQGWATNLDIYPDLDWVAVVLSNDDIPVAPIVDKERELITRLGT